MKILNRPFGWPLKIGIHAEQIVHYVECFQGEPGCLRSSTYFQRSIWPTILQPTVPVQSASGKPHLVPVPVLPPISLANCLFVHQIEWQNPYLHPKLNLREGNNDRCHPFLPSSKHQQMVIKTPRSVIKDPFQLAVKRKLKLKQTVPQLHNFQITPKFPHRT